VQHLEIEEPFEIARALERAGVEIEVARVFAGHHVPSDCSAFSSVVVMGGPMSAREDEGFASRRAEIALLRGAVERGLPVLGVCLGAQLLAAACGGSVRVGEAGPEIGWGTVELTDEALNDALFSGMPERIPVLHWHSETFDLPPGAVHLAGSSKYPNQAFRIGERAWGLQFHLEVDEQAAASFVAAFGDEEIAAGAIPSAIDEASGQALGLLAPQRDRVLDRFAALVGSPMRSKDFHGDSAALPSR